MRAALDFNADLTLWQRWLETAQKFPDQEAIIHWTAEAKPIRWKYGPLVSAAIQYSKFLKSHGVQSDQVCALMFRHQPYFYPLYMAVSACGSIPAVIAYPNSRLHPQKFREGIEGMSQHSGLDWILTDREFTEILNPVVQSKENTIKGIIFSTDEIVNDGISRDLKNINAETNSSAALLQHSSGTTGLQKPVLLSQRAVINHLIRYAQAIGLCPDDKVVSWLPLYHDMGLIAAFHLPLYFGIPSVQIDPLEWVIIPELLLEAVSKEKGTLTWMPNFAYNLMADKIHAEDLNDNSLTSWRMVINSSEPIRDTSHEKFVKKFERCGLRKNTLSSSYAMAEMVFAVSQSEPGAEPRRITVDKIELAKGKIKIMNQENSGTVCVSSGKILQGCEVRVVDDSGKQVGDRELGDVLLRSESMFDGYRNYPEKSQEVLKNGWYASGDVGFLHDGEIYIMGRKKDIIIVGGNNIFPEDVEAIVSAVEGVVPGRTVAFGEEDIQLGTEQVCVVAETNVDDVSKRQPLRERIIKSAMDAGISIRKVYLVEPKWLIKSSSGKPSRKANKERIIKENPNRHDIR